MYEIRIRRYYVQYIYIRHISEQKRYVILFNISHVYDYGELKASFVLLHTLALI